MHIHKKILGAKQRKYFCDHKNRAILETQRLALSDKNIIYIYKSFIYITREVFVRHTVLHNLKMPDMRDQYLLILTVVFSQNQSGKMETRRHNQFLGRSVMTTDSRAGTRPWDCHVELDGRAVCSVYRVVSNVTASKLCCRMSFGGHGAGFGYDFWAGTAYFCPKVWKCCSLAAAHTHKNSKTYKSYSTSSVNVTKQFFLHYESRPGTVYTVTRCKWPKFKKCVRKMVLNVHIKTYLPIYMYER